MSPSSPIPALRFVHAADLHLDSPFTGLRSIAPAIAEHLYNATFEAYEALINLCIEEHVDAFLVAGDIYDSADRSLRAQLKFVDGLRRLDAEGIQSFVCHGNHDPLDGWEARLTLPASCHRFGPALETVPIDISNPDKGTVSGLSYPRREVRDNLARTWQNPAPSGFHIGLLHCNAGGNRDHEAYAPCTIEDLAATNVDYWALGHLHTRQVLRPAGPAIVYPGNLQGLQPNETGGRGAYLVEVSAAGAIGLDFRPLDSVRWEGIDIRIEGIETEQQLLDEIEAGTERVMDSADGRHVILRVKLVGRGPLHHTTHRVGFDSELQESINDQWSDRDPFAWCERVEVVTRPAVDRERQRQAGDFVGDVLRLVDQARDDEATLKELSGQLEALYNHRSARRYLQRSISTREDLSALLSEAEARCLDLLLEDSQ